MGLDQEESHYKEACAGLVRSLLRVAMQEHFPLALGRVPYTPDTSCPSLLSAVTQASGSETALLTNHCMVQKLLDKTKPRMRCESPMPRRACILPGPHSLRF